jgi:hypothetical protein
MLQSEIWLNVFDKDGNINNFFITLTIKQLGDWSKAHLFCLLSKQWSDKAIVISNKKNGYLQGWSTLSSLKCHPTRPDWIIKLVQALISWKP